MKLAMHIATPLALAILTNAGATEIDLSKLPPPATQPGLTFTKDIQPLMEASCVRCHGNNRPKAGLQLNSLEGVLKGSKDRKVVLPGDSKAARWCWQCLNLMKRRPCRPSSSQARAVTAGLEDLAVLPRAVLVLMERVLRLEVQDPVKPAALRRVPVATVRADLLLVAQERHKVECAAGSVRPRNR
ncbi:MAG TPA: c-type cytochrome domain-containing protein [Verrucomicrobiae bacterium]|nr:c-type cytochrome domain-containing protein [Verrucomicrobiae bacterium]